MQASAIGVKSPNILILYVFATVSPFVVFVSKSCILPMKLTVAEKLQQSRTQLVLLFFDLPCFILVLHDVTRTIQFFLTLVEFPRNINLLIFIFSNDDRVTALWYVFTFTALLQDWVDYLLSVRNLNANVRFTDTVFCFIFSDVNFWGIIGSKYKKMKVIVSR